MELGIRDRHREGDRAVHRQVTRTIKGNEVTRNATDDDPAYLIEQEDGDRVLKSGSELTKR